MSIANIFMINDIDHFPNNEFREREQNDSKRDKLFAIRPFNGGYFINLSKSVVKCSI